MYYYISGRLVLVGRGVAVIDNNGIGYEITVSDKTAGRLQGLDTDNVRLYTHYHVKEDSEELYGFYSTEEKRIFELLISISGVGPKAAMAILSTLSPESFTMAVVSDDAKSISAAQGIGLRTAQKIILELRDKIGGGDIPLITPKGKAPAQTSAVKDALMSLEALGYSRSEAMKALSFDGSENMPLEELIRHALKRLTKQ